MDEPELPHECAQRIATKLRRLIALVAAADDMASTVVADDENLGHTQELLGAACETCPELVVALDSLIAMLADPPQLRAA